MKNRNWLLLALLTLSVSGAQAQLKGAGSSFAARLYGGWSQVVAKGADSRLDYSPVGSSGGVKAVVDRSVDFGASDRPMSRSQLEQAGLVQFPTAVGGVVVFANLPGIPSDKVRLDGAVLAAMYLGTIKDWNDPALKALNPSLNLPALAITPVYRAEGSGTSFVLTNYLSKVNPAFKTAIGPTSTFTVAGGKGAKSTGETLRLVQATPGAFGYSDYAFAIDNSLSTTQMKNQWGRFVVASIDSLQVAMRAANWEILLIDQEPTFELDLTDAGCPGCWPIASTTYVLVPLKGRNGNSARVLDFFEQALRQGDESANQKGYVPLPTRAKNIVSLAMRRWNTSLDKSGAGRPQRRTEGDGLPTLLAAR